MEKIDYLIILLFFILFLTTFYTINKINKFMIVLKTCEDDFAVIDKCGCIPCTWKDETKYNGNASCLSYNLTWMIQQKG